MKTIIKEKIEDCEHCSLTLPAHRSVYITASLTAYLNDWTVALRRVNIFRVILDFLRNEIFVAEPYLMHALHVMTGSQVNIDPVHARTTRAASLWHEALAREIRIEQLKFFGTYTDSFRAMRQVRGKGRWVYFESLPIPPKRLSHAFQWSDDKLLFKQFLMSHQIPAAPGYTAQTIVSAQERLEGLQKPVVVKPRIGTNSRHTTPLVNSDKEFIDAFSLSQELCREVIIEEYLAGHLCRATVVDGKLVGFLESQQPEVVGDGVHSIRDLIQKHNAQKPERASEIVLSELNEAHVRRQGYEFGSILEGGTHVQVSQYPGRGSGGENREILHDVHPEMREVVERTANLMKIPVVGFDLIVDNPKENPHGKRWGILEANTVPFIQIHDNPLYGEPSNVAAAVWDLWLRNQ
jgi:D-alanine-D-alanine ligase-like ATP-grasp enzyme